MENNHGKIPESLASYLCEGTPEAVIARYADLPRRAHEETFGVFEKNVVVVDTETTGISFAHDELIQIAAARIEHDTIVGWYVTFVDPGKPIPEEIAHLTGISDSDVAGAPSPEEALAGLVEFVGDAFLVAHNAEFDRTFTTKHPAGYPLLDNVWIDSLDLARIALPRMKSHRLLDLVRAFDAPVSTHRADDDVASTCALFRILLAAVAAMPRELASRIGSFAPDEWPTSVVFREIAGPETEPLSVRGLRKARVGSQPHRSKPDADALAADPEKGLAFPTAEEIAAAFDAAGIVGSLYEGYETRPEQSEMAEAVRAAFASSENLVVEAGTGVGKSMAYLVPAALTAKRNDIAVGVATKTNALLDQLVNNELPRLAEKIEGLTFAPLKGFSHYVCLRKAEQLAVAGPRMRLVAGKEETQAPALAGLLSFIEQTSYGDADSLKVDYRRLPRATFTTTSRDCLRRACPYFGTTCYVHGARRAAEEADIVVTNHSLLFCDLVADGGLLPPIRYWIVDEAHGTEAEARKAFSLRLAAEDVKRLGDRLSSDESARNPFVKAERTAVERSDEAGATLLYALTSKAKASGRAFSEAGDQLARHLRDFLYFDSSKKSKGYETVDLWLNDDIRGSGVFKRVAEVGAAFTKAAETYVRDAQDVVALLEEYDGAAAAQREIASTVLAVKDLISSTETILESPSEAYAYAATLSRKADRPRDELQALLFDVGEKLGETLLAHTHSTVFASATITIDGSFEPFERALGLNAGESSKARLVQLDSSYDFDRQMTVYVAEDMPEPTSPAYLDALSRLLVDVHIAQNGSVLTLFTNRREMEKCYEAVQPEVRAHGLRLVCQKWGVSAKGLRDDFLADEHLSLFALKSFWEGFDAPGATLKCVVIPKLPFSRPTDPLSCERAARDDGAWRHYVLPAAVIETKQAAGRLIRSADDEGSLVFADSRLVTKRYGKAFLNSLPSSTVLTEPCSRIAQLIADQSERQS